MSKNKNIVAMIIGWLIGSVIMSGIFLVTDQINNIPFQISYILSVPLTLTLIMLIRKTPSKKNRDEDMKCKEKDNSEPMDYDERVVSNTTDYNGVYGVNSESLYTLLDIIDKEDKEETPKSFNEEMINIKKEIEEVTSHQEETLEEVRSLEAKEPKLIEAYYKNGHNYFDTEKRKVEEETGPLTLEQIEEIVTESQIIIGKYDDETSKEITQDEYDTFEEGKRIHLYEQDKIVNDIKSLMRMVKYNSLSKEEMLRVVEETDKKVDAFGSDEEAPDIKASSIIDSIITIELPDGTILSIDTETGNVTSAIVDANGNLTVFNVEVDNQYE